MHGNLWGGVTRLIDRSGSLLNLRAHGLHMLAARRWRERRLSVPDDLAREELVIIQRTFNATRVLQAMRDAYDGRLLVLKGPEVAERYPEAYLRPFSDLDVLAEDVDEAQRALLAAGFEAVGPYEDTYYERLHHARPLRSPFDPAPIVEIHRAPNWMKFGDPPERAELMAVGVPSATGVPGVLALPAAHHAAVLAAHSWAEKPLRRIMDLVDVAVMASEADLEEITAIAARWEMSRVWDTTHKAAGALLFDDARPWSMLIWARDLETVRDRTVLEDHARGWLGPYWALPPGRAMRAMASAVAGDVTPAPTENWSNKLVRVREALSHPARSHSEHEQTIGTEGIQPRHRHR